MNFFYSVARFRPERTHNFLGSFLGASCASLRNLSGTPLAMSYYLWFFYYALLSTVSVLLLVVSVPVSVLPAPISSYPFPFTSCSVPYPLSFPFCPSKFRSRFASVTFRPDGLPQWSQKTMFICLLCWQLVLHERWALWSIRTQVQ